MKAYLDLMQDILDNSEDKMDRTSVGTRSVFGRQLRFDLKKGFPAVTTKKLAFNAVKSELLWFISGSSSEKDLREILYSDRNSEKQTIWTANANADYWKSKAEFEGDLGRVYGKQLRDWLTPIQHFGVHNGEDAYTVKHTDQLLNLIDGLKTDPNGRRHIICWWNAGEVAEGLMALPACHAFAQFHVNSKKELSCMVTIRSNDIFLGNPFNVASYALFNHMIAQVCGYTVNELVVSIGDAHIYLNHIDQVREQLSREPLPLPTLWLNPDITDIEKFTMDDIQLEDYQSHQSIKAPMAV
jgi:thymidylate synthase